jgi:hypothetical protein
MTFNGIKLSNIRSESTRNELGVPAIRYSTYCNGIKHTFTISAEVIEDMRMAGVDMDTEILHLMEHEIQYLYE